MTDTSQTATIELWWDAVDSKWHWALNFKSMDAAKKTAMLAAAWASSPELTGKSRMRWTAKRAARRALKKLGRT